MEARATTNKFILIGFPLFWLAYLLLVHFTLGLQWEHFVLVGFLITLFVAHPKSRQWTLDFFPFVIFGILYDFLRIYPKTWAGSIHIVEPYQVDVTIFDCLGFNKGTIPTDFFIQHNHPIMDLIAGLTYGAHILIPVGFAIYLWCRQSPYFNSFRWAFLLMNLAAFVTYIAYPAAPPWYVTEYGLENLGWDVPSSAAGLIRFDILLGIEYFQNTYARSSWIFGAIPSMHAGFPLFLSLFARKILGWGRWFFYIFTVLAAFAAIYLNHHYFIDVLAGWVYALVFYAVAMLLTTKGRDKLKTNKRTSAMSPG